MIPASLDSQVRRLHLVARRAVEDWLGGAYHSVFKGVGIAFEEVREYQPGDDVRAIDWNVTARAGAPFVKRFVEERELTVVLAVDCGASMQFASGSLSKRQVAVELAALMTLAALRNNDRVGLLQFGEGARRYMAPRKGSRHALRLFRHLLDGPALNAAATGGVAEALVSLNRAIHRRALVVLASDFLSSDWLTPLRLAATRHDLIVLRIQDAWELELPNVGILSLDHGDRPILLDTRDATVREKYRERMADRARRIHGDIRRAGAECLELTTSGNHLDELRRCFDTRRRGLA